MPTPKPPFISTPTTMVPEQKVCCALGLLCEEILDKRLCGFECLPLSDPEDMFCGFAADMQTTPGMFVCRCCRNNSRKNLKHALVHMNLISGIISMTSATPEIRIGQSFGVILSLGIAPGSITILHLSLATVEGWVPRMRRKFLCIWVVFTCLLKSSKCTKIHSAAEVHLQLPFTRYTTVCQKLSLRSNKVPKYEHIMKQIRRY